MPNATRPHFSDARNSTWAQLRLRKVGGLLAHRCWDLPQRTVRSCLPSGFAWRKPPSNAFQRRPPATGTVQHGLASPLATHNPQPPLPQALCRPRLRPTPALLLLSRQPCRTSLRLQRPNAASFATALGTWNDPRRTLPTTTAPTPIRRTRPEIPRNFTFGNPINAAFGARSPTSSRSTSTSAHSMGCKPPWPALRLPPQQLHGLNSDGTSLPPPLFPRPRRFGVIDAGHRHCGDHRVPRRGPLGRHASSTGSRRG